MKIRFILILIVMNLLCTSVLGQNSENPFGEIKFDPTSLKGEIYYLQEGASSLPDFSTLTPAGSIYTRVLDIPTRSFTSGFPGVADRIEWFAIKYAGSFNIDQEGEYAFRLVSDDGSRLFIDGTKIIDNDGLHPTQSVSGTVYLSRGQHSVEVDYFQGPREEIALQLFWTPPGGTETISNPQFTPASPPPQSSLYTALYRWFSTRSGDHFYTTDPSGELAPSTGYNYEGITGYIWVEAPGSATSIPSSLRECETYTSEICGTWTLEGDHFNAEWDNGAIAVLKVQSWDTKNVIITRYDSEGASAGLSARYEGQISGNTIEDGTVTWTWKGSTWSGTWKANW